MRATPTILVALIFAIAAPASRVIAVPPPLCFTEVSTGLPEIGWSAVAWGDYDNDGDLDILLSGYGNPNITRVYRNSGGPTPTFTDILTGLPGAFEGEVAWADFDGDGDLDITITGWGGCGKITKIYRNNGGPNPLFTDTLIDLPGVTRSALAWGDYDNDGDLDLLLTGHENDFSRPWTSRIFRNSGGPSPTFTDIGAGLEGVRHGSVAWGDYDEDGDLDILMTGDANGMPVVPMVYVSSGGLNPTFADAGQGNTEGPHTAAAWGDYDSDGDLDIVLSGDQTVIWTNFQIGAEYHFQDQHPTYVGGRDGTVSWGDFDNDGYGDLLIVGYDFFGAGGAKIYRNSGTSPNYPFSIYNAALPSVGENESRSASVWGDYDGDGDLDILHSGSQNGLDTVRLYRNDCGPANAPPAAPTNLSMTQVGMRATFQWNASTDDHTPSNGLSYNLRVGTAPGACDVVSPMANATTGTRRIPALGNAMQRTSWQIELSGAGPFYWSVQAVDGAYVGSPFAAEANTAPSAVDDVPVPATTGLRSDGPNPFSHVTTASFSLANSGHVSLAVYDVAGRRVRTLAAADYPAGVFEQTWDGRDDAGRLLSSGVYFVRMNAASREESVKVLLAH